MTMEKTLQRLDSHIKKLRPDFYKSLQEPLSKEEIQRMEEQYNVQIPEDLKAFYQWKNGQESSCYDSFVNNSMFIPLDEALETAEELTSMIGTDFEIENWWNRNWIPVFHNGGGSYLCYDREGIFTGNRGQILEFWNRDHDRNVIAPDFQHFLEQLNIYYTGKSAEEFDGFFDVEDIDGFPKRFIVG